MGYPELMWWGIGILVALGVVRVGAVIVSRVWFRAKLNYQRSLIEGLTGGETNGKSVEE